MLLLRCGTVRGKTAFSARFEEHIYAIEVSNKIIHLYEKINLFTHADTKFFILIIYVNLGIKNCNNDFNDCSKKYTFVTLGSARPINDN